MRPLRLGFDMDGVLADFVTAFLTISNKLYGTSYTKKDWTQWSATNLYTDAQQDKVWDIIRTTKEFWYKLEPLEHGALLDAAERKHNLYFITSRVYVPGRSIEQQSAGWLLLNKRLTFPTVLVVSDADHKQALCRDLQLDAFIDDKASTVEQINKAGVLCYVYDQPYNSGVKAPRVSKILDYVSSMEDSFGGI